MIVADVAGHGIAAALSMSKLSAEVRLLAGTLKSPARILNTLNANLWRQGLDTRFITLLLAMLDPARHQVTLACAGHMPPILRRRGGSLFEPGRQRYGPPLGAVRDVLYEETSFRIEPGDTLTLYTDGITEATDPADEMYGEERLRARIAAAHAPQEIMESVIDDVRQFTQRRPPEDDICLVCFGRRAADEPPEVGEVTRWRNAGVRRGSV